MGIRGLLRFLHKGGQIIKLHKITLVVDGGGFFDFLAQWKPTACDLITGDCPGLFQTMITFLALMKINEVKLVFVLDGAPESLKEHTKHLRIKSRWKSFQTFHQSGRDRSKWTGGPLYRPATYWKELKKISPESEVIVVDGEADQWVALFAIQRRGLVFGNDSDFFVLENPGYLLSTSLSENKGSVTAKLFQPSDLSRALGGFPLPFLPAWATLCENDFIKSHELLSIYRYMQIESFACVHQKVAASLSNFLRKRRYTSYHPTPFWRKFQMNWQLIHDVCREAKSELSPEKLQCILMKFLSCLPLENLTFRDKNGLWLAQGKPPTFLIPAINHCLR